MPVKLSVYDDLDRQSIRVDGGYPCVDQYTGLSDAGGRLYLWARRRQRRRVIFTSPEAAAAARYSCDTSTHTDGRGTHTKLTLDLQLYGTELTCGTRSANERTATRYKTGERIQGQTHWPTKTAHSRLDVIRSLLEALTLPDQLHDHAAYAQRRQLLSAFVLCTPTARSPGTADRTRSARNNAEFRTCSPIGRCSLTISDSKQFWETRWDDVLRQFQVDRTDIIPIQQKRNITNNNKTGYYTY